MTAILLVVLCFAIPAQDPGGDPAAQARDLIEKLRSDKVEVREEAARKLKEMGKAALPELEKATMDNDSEVAGRALILLKAINARELLGPAIPKAMPGIDGRLASGEAHSWTDAMMELLDRNGKTLLLLEPGKKAPREGVPLLKASDLDTLANKALQGANTTKEKTTICGLASRMGIRSVIPELTRLLKDEDPEVRGHSAFALTRMKFTEAVPEIARLLTDGHWLLRQVACQYLADLEAKKMAPQIAARLGDNVEWVRESAAKALGQLGTTECVPELEEALKDEKECVREAATAALKRIQREK